MNGVYDYVVVGGGTSGCVIATRLSEDSSVSVLLLEAGGDESHPDVQDPSRWESLQNTDADWAYRTIEQPCTGRSHPAPRGKVLGGSGSINCMTHLRGHRADFDEWSSLGADGWDFAGVLGYFQRSEDVPDGDRTYRGVGGPLSPRTLGRPNPVAAAFVQGAVQVGHGLTADFNADEMIGVGYAEVLVKGGRRESTATAYLRPAVGRPNLTVKTGALTLGLLIRNGRCEGVRFVGEGAVQEVAAGEVILAAGAVGSPHLLMVSGIGSADQLQRAGTPVAVDLPGVGQNLQDHILLAGIRHVTDRPLGETSLDDPTLLARTHGGTAGPDLMLSPMAFDYHMPWQEPMGRGITFAIGHMRPVSRGSIELRSSDPTVAPSIDPAYLREDADLRALMLGVEMVDDIVRTGVYEDWGGWSETTRLLDLPAGDAERAVKDAVSSYFHLSGTCRMGHDQGSVVDAHLRTHGIEGLRVADASVMPTVVSCNTNAASVMIGEKAADLIRGRSLRVDLDGDAPAVG